MEYSQHIKAAADTRRPTTNSNSGKSIEANQSAISEAGFRRVCLCFCFSQLTDMTVSGLADSPQTQTWSSIYPLLPRRGCTETPLHAPKTIQCEIYKLLGLKNYQVSDQFLYLQHIMVFEVLQMSAPSYCPSIGKGALF